MNEGKKVRLHLTLDETLNETLTVLAKNSRVSKSYIVERALRYYIEHQGQSYPELYEVLKSLFLPIHQELKRLRYSSNDFNRSSMMMKEFMNHYFATENKFDLITTDKKYTGELADLELLIESRMKAKRTNKLSD